MMHRYMIGIPVICLIISYFVFPKPFEDLTTPQTVIDARAQQALRDAASQALSQASVGMVQPGHLAETDAQLAERLAELGQPLEAPYDAARPCPEVESDSELRRRLAAASYTLQYTPGDDAALAAEHIEDAHKALMNSDHAAALVPAYAGWRELAALERHLPHQSLTESTGMARAVVRQLTCRLD